MLGLESLTSRMIVSLTYLSSSCFYFFSFASIAYYVQRISDNLLSYEHKYNVENVSKSNESVSNNNQTNDQKTSGDERILNHNDERPGNVKTRERVINLDASMSSCSSIDGKNMKQTTSSTLREKWKSGEIGKNKKLVGSFLSKTEQITPRTKYSNLHRSEKPTFKSCSSFIETIV